MSSGGGGANGTTRYEWNDDMAGYWRGALARAAGQSEQPYQQYNGTRVADFTNDQRTGMDAVRNYVTDPSGFLYGRGVDQFYNTLEGKYLTGDGANPFSVVNSHADDSPYFEKTLKTGMDDITNAYQNGTAADTTRMFNLAGAFGGSAHQNAIANNQAALAKQLGNYDSQMRNDQYNRSAGMEESALQRGSGNYEAERQRQMMAGTASQADQGLTLDRYNALLGIGGMQQNQNQRIADVNYQNWQDQNNYGKNQLAWLTSILSAAQGGLPPSQMTSQSSSPWANAAGAGLAAYGLFRS